MDAQYSRIAKYANQSRREKLSQFAVGHFVKLRRLGRLAKYATPFCGPFKILDILPAGAIKLDLPAGSRISAWVNVEHLEPFLGHIKSSRDILSPSMPTNTQSSTVEEYILRD